MHQNDDALPHHIDHVIAQKHNGPTVESNLALACDIVIAARSSSFAQSFVKIGLVPDSGGTTFCHSASAWPAHLASRSRAIS